MLVGTWFGAALRALGAAAARSPLCSAWCPEEGRSWGFCFGPVVASGFAFHVGDGDGPGDEVAEGWHCACSID